MVLICDGSKENLWCIKSILRGFELMSGLCINLNKSKLYGVNLDNYVMLAALSFFACQIGKFPFLFLAISIGGNRRRNEFWAFMLTKLKKRLNIWSEKHLSLGGKVTLLNSVLNSIPIFLLSFFKTPKYVLEGIIKVQRDFLWGKGDGGRKVCWVS